MSTRTPPGPGRRVVASLWAAAAMPFIVLALWVPAARALGLFDRVPVLALVVLGTLAGPALVAALPRLAAYAPETGRRPPPAQSKLPPPPALFALFSLPRLSPSVSPPRPFSPPPLRPPPSRPSSLAASVLRAPLPAGPAASVYPLAFVEEAVDPPPPLPPTAPHFRPSPPPSARPPLPPPLLPRPFPYRGGHLHLAAVALCLLCWVTLEKQRDGLTGTLLAAATLAKIFPGLLGVLLLMQKRWRAVGFTVLAAAAICALSVAVLGTKVWSDFLFYHLPNVQSGTALRFMAGTSREIAFNIAPFGVPFKLAALGLGSLGWAEARIIGNVYTLIVLVLAALAGRKKGSPAHRLTAWLAILLLASLRSPYAAPFILSTMVVLLLVLATELRSPRGVAALIATWVMFLMPMPIADAKGQIALSLVRTVPLYFFLVWAALRKDPGLDGLQRAEDAAPPP